MLTVNIHDAKTNLSKLVAAAAAGEPFIIARAGKPLVKVTAIDATEAKPRRRIGFMAGMYAVPKDVKAFGGEHIQAMFDESLDKLK